MSWNCTECNEELGDYNGWCEYCWINSNKTIKVFNPDKYFIRAEHILEHVEEIVMFNNNMNAKELLEHIESNANMTPQEKLHAQLFYHETILVKDMDRLSLDAHIEELSKIAFEARARLGAATADKERRNKANKSEGPRGFEKSINVDEATTNTLNVIKEKQTRLTKGDKIRQMLLKVPGMDPNFVNQAMSAKNILSQVKKVQNTSKENIPEEPKIAVFNPFEKK